MPPVRWRRVWRFTPHQASVSGEAGPIGKSEWNDNGIPRLNTDAARTMLSALGPRPWSCIGRRSRRDSRNSPTRRNPGRADPVDLIFGGVGGGTMTVRVVVLRSVGDALPMVSSTRSSAASLLTWIWLPAGSPIRGRERPEDRRVASSTHRDDKDPGVPASSR